jgi:Trk-type K+ transport system membrane component
VPLQAFIRAAAMLRGRPQIFSVLVLFRPVYRRP